MTESAFAGMTRLRNAIQDAGSQGLSNVNFHCRATDDPATVAAAASRVELSASFRKPDVTIIAGTESQDIAPAKLPKDGTIAREGDTVVVRAMGSHLAGLEGVNCENPDAPEEERIYRKEFHSKKIYLPDELETAKQDVLLDRDVIILGMTGYSNIGKEQCAQLGITEEAYVAACADLLGGAVIDLQREFPGVRVKVVDGASDMGVDKGTITVADKLNLDHLGFSCPKFMFYVKDDDAPVYVAKTQADYADAFVRSLDILFSVGGRMQALEHDMLAAIKDNKRLVLLNVLAAISPNGGPPARDGSGKIQDATAAFEEAVIQTAPAVAGIDPYEALRESAQEGARRIARKILAPERAYGKWIREA